MERHPEHLALRLDRGLYPEQAIFRTCYTFTDRCYLFLRRDGDGHLVVEFRPRKPNADVARIIGEFGNELINQRIRYSLACETQAIRELIVTQAFAEARFETT